MANKIQQGHVNYLNQGLKATSLKNAFKDAVADGIDSINITNLNTSEATNFNSMFSGCTVPVTINPIDMYNATDCDYMFSKTQVRNIHLKNVPKDLISNIGGTENTEYIIDSYKYNYDGTYGPIPNESGFVDLSNYAKKYIPNYQTITEIPEENLKYLQSGLKANNMNNMFYYCKNLVTIPKLDIDTSKVTSMSGVFGSCNNLTNLDLSNFNTSNVTYMGTMFSICNSLTSLNLSSFNTSNVTSMYGIFNGCQNLTNLDISNFDTANVTNMERMFYGCQNLTNIKGALDLNKCNNVDNIFDYCNDNMGIHLKNVSSTLMSKLSSSGNGTIYIIDNYID